MREVRERKNDKELIIEIVEDKINATFDNALARNCSVYLNSKSNTGYVLEVSKYSEIAQKINNGKQDVLFQISEETYNAVQNALEEEKNELIALEQSKAVKTWEWWFKDGEFSLYQDDVNLKYRKDIKEIIDFIKANKNLFIKQMEEYSIKKGYKEYLISNDDLMKIYNQIREKINNVKEKEIQRIHSLIQIAKETGELQTIRSWTEDCDGSVQDCDCDRVYEKIDGEGKISLHRVHTF